jgi:formylglycine-generating enzyme required for sulfatase activity
MQMKVVFSVLVLSSVAAWGAVDFVKEVQPILEYNCLRCHTPEATAVKEDETSYLLNTAKGAIRGRFIIPGKGAESKVYKLAIVPDDDPDLMPPLKEIKKKSSRRLTKAETETLKTWIDEGAKWPEGVTLIARKEEVVRYPNDTPALIAEIHKQIVATTTEKEEKEMKPYATSIIGTDVMFEVVPIPSGKFKMGSPANEKGRGADEGPQKEVAIEPFWMGKTEVTWDSFLLFMFHEEEVLGRKSKQIPVTAQANVRMSDETTHPSKPYVEMSFGMGTEGFPAISMTQHAANKYCQWLSARTGHFYRLPTEAEWEYAARAGTSTAYFWGDDAAQMGDYCWWGKNSPLGYQKVGKKKANPWGLHDILGNVTEWTLDQYDPGYYATMPAGSPWNRATQPYPHSARGGSWDDEDPTKLRAAVRRASNAEWKRLDPQLPKSYWYHTDAQFLGFRMVRPLKVPSAEEMGKYWNSGVEKDDPKMKKVE